MEGILVQGSLPFYTNRDRDMEIVNGLFPTIETLGDRGTAATPEEIAAFASAVTRIQQGPVLWNMFNALAFLILVSIVFVVITLGQQQAQQELLQARPQVQQRVLPPELQLV